MSLQIYIHFLLLFGTAAELKIFLLVFLRKFLPAFRYMLEWHGNHLTYEEGGQFLIRQHASALLATVSSISSPVGAEVEVMLADVLHDCCCNWFYKATRFGVKEVGNHWSLYVCNCFTCFNLGRGGVYSLIVHY